MATILIHNVPPQTREDYLRSFLRPLLANLGITSFECQLTTRSNAPTFLTVLDLHAAKIFVNMYRGPDRRGRPRGTTLKLFQQPLALSLSYSNPDPYTIRSLELQLTEQMQKVPKVQNAARDSTHAKREHRVKSLSCGLWDYDKKCAIFVPAYTDPRQGSLILGRQSLLVVLENDQGRNEHYLDIPYGTVESITLSTSPPGVSLNIKEPPKFYNFPEVDPIEYFFRNLTLDGRSRRQQEEKKRRVVGLSSGHATVSGSLVYRIDLVGASGLQDVRRIFTAHRQTPNPINLSVFIHHDVSYFQKHLAMFHKSLSSSQIPFSLKFQLQKLATNCFLSHRLTNQVLEKIAKLREVYDDVPLMESLKTFAFQLPYAGPQTDADKFSLDNMINSIVECAKSFTKAGTIYDLVERYQHLALIHKVTITPTSMYLEGPELETKNRVLRKYSGHDSDFVRVTFAEENYDRIYNEYNVDRSAIFSDRFKSIINGALAITFKSFLFLGFSHSSLRAAQCFFMAPFVLDGTLINAERVRRDLGNFAAIRSPARCAARIGQAFTDATNTVILAKSSVIMGAPDIERNGRVFTDGVGKISIALLKRVWREFSRTKKLRPTILQIRYQGAKGLLALDTTLRDEVAIFRQSMIKFEESQDSDLEICGAAYSALPMYLNRQLIKILEDLYVSEQAFLDLQRNAVQQVYMMTTSPVNAANFLTDNRVGQATGLPGFIRLLGDIGLHFRSDDFISLCVEITAVAQLRQIKYRARIRVDDAHTLYGIVDETGFLRPHQVYVSIEQDNGSKEIRTGRAFVTRAPAMHPGDVQPVEAIDIPDDSPLKSLHNCIVFSQHGERDLPSMLSGGDLDGDLYNVIFDPNLQPKRYYQAADYPRVAPLDIQRPVEASDMTQFFLTFMETDQLGHICNTHLQIADQKDDGTLSDECLKLAAMASTAVDYSKTGIAVDLGEFPDAKSYARRAKPDFMANAPSLFLDEQNKVQLKDFEDMDDDIDDVAALEPDRKRTQYYESTKVLGKLYRAIDERKFITELRSKTVEEMSKTQLDSSLMEELWAFIKLETLLLLWEHHRQLARDIRDVYEERLVDTAHLYKIDQSHPLTEIEVFAGCILGRKGGVPDKRTRELNIDMRDKFNRDVKFIVEWILYGDNVREEEFDPADPFESSGADAHEALERSIACLAVAMQEEGKIFRQMGRMKSFKVVAGSVCLSCLKQTLGYLPKYAK